VGGEKAEAETRVYPKFCKRRFPGSGCIADLLKKKRVDDQRLH